MKSKKLPQLSVDKVDQLIAMAWSDRASFECIEQKTGLNEIAVITFMRHHLKRKSFCIWRQRVSGRKTKHLRQFRQFQISR
jgi:uncharacterized protein (TIGR03643 family)